MRFLRHDGIYRSDVSLLLVNPAQMPPPVGRPRCQAIARDGRSTPCPSSAMSSDRLFLDRVGRHQSPSPLHRHEQNNMHPAEPRAKGDISTLPARGHFYFALTNILTTLWQQSDNVPFEQSRNVLLTAPSFGDAGRTTTHDTSRPGPASGAKESQEETDYSA